MKKLSSKCGRFAGIISIVTMLGLLLGMAVSAQGAEPPLDGFLKGRFKVAYPVQPAPQTRFKDGAGRNVSLGKFRGRVVLLNFWATWCAPCVSEMPHLNSLQARLKNEGLAVVTVSVDSGGSSVVKPFLQKHGLRHLKPYLDPSQNLMDQFNAAGLPTTVLIDTRGQIVGKLRGPADWSSEAAVKLIRYYLGRPHGAPDSGGSLEWTGLGDEDAAYDAYHRGDYATAYSNWRPLAEAGDAGAQFNLGVLYDLGQAVAVDRTQAASWYGKSAAQDFAAAQYQLAVLFAEGDGVARDTALAYALFDLAAEEDPEAAQQRDALAQVMTGPQIDRATRLVEQARARGIGQVLGVATDPDRALIQAVQEALTSLGYDAGAADGMTGPRTRAAVRAFQADSKIAVDGQVSEQLLERLQAAVN